MMMPRAQRDPPQVLISLTALSTSRALAVMREVSRSG